jgi:hypothetical protein
MRFIDVLSTAQLMDYVFLSMNRILRELTSSFWSMADTRADMASRVCVYCVHFRGKKAHSYTAHLVIARDGNSSNTEIKIA